MRFQVDIDCNNAAFGETDADTSNEVADILHTLSLVLQGQPDRDSGPLYDTNGNFVGRWSFENE